MWQAVPITEDTYGFQHIENYHEPWAAIVSIQSTEGSLSIQAHITMTYLTNKEEYEQLKESIQTLAREVKSAQQATSVRLQFDCKGISSFEGETPIPTKAHPAGLTLFNEEFSEEF
ncbi:hypothetical protein [Ammoniphilus sp. CFH 90114]|uniref:hypothetical protein n=1 Tax=Ammoniphilus sp. CFH 90114 TaxID=2493665 RepID=UPI00100EA275|nr:hypothetical protein [Ammoniphilus sp. CFH 90114]RXT07239.1 hypothetical protein EIZ39_13940 [Ammoniphilus sp. CFH 90114]